MWSYLKTSAWLPPASSWGQSRQQRRLSSAPELAAWVRPKPTGSVTFGARPTAPIQSLRHRRSMELLIIRVPGPVRQALRQIGSRPTATALRRSTTLYQTPPTNIYTYTLANFTAPLTDIIILWATDNGAQFFLNGTLLDSIPAPTISDTPYTPLQSFVILASAFAASNTFEVVVTNLAYSGANPTGLVVDVSAVPLPPAALLFGSALLGLTWLRRRRSQKIGAIG